MPAQCPSLGEGWGLMLIFGFKLILQSSGRCLLSAQSVPLSRKRLRPRCRELQSLIDFSSTLRCRRYDTADTVGFNHKEFSFVLWQSKIDQINSFDSVITCVWSREEEATLPGIVNSQQPKDDNCWRGGGRRIKSNDDDCWWRGRWGGLETS